MNIPTHPCVYQKGSCKFGDKCRFYYIRGDACLFHLRQQKNGGEGCRYGNNCKNRHINLFDGNDVYHWKEREQLLIMQQEGERRIKSMEYEANATLNREVMESYLEERERERLAIIQQKEETKMDSIKWETNAASVRQEMKRIESSNKSYVSKDKKRIGSSNRSDISKEKKRSEKIIKSLQNKERLKELSKKPDKLIVFTVSGPKEINPYDEDSNITKRYQREISEHQKIQGEKERLQRKVDPIKRQQHKEYKANMDRDTYQEYNGYIPGGKWGCTNCNGGCSCCVDSHPSQNYEYSRFAQ